MLAHESVTTRREAPRVDSRAPWTSTSTRGRSCSVATGSPCPRVGSPPSPAEARAAAEELGFPVVVKAQVLIGGRGKAGGIKLAADADEAEARAAEILGMDIRGHTVTKLWIEQASDIAREYYLSLTFDRSAKKPLFMFTTQGGMEIEEVAATSPDALVRLHVDPLEGGHPWHGRRLVYDGGVADPGEQKQIAAIVLKLYDAFVGTEAMLCEINPLDRHARRRGARARLQVHRRRQRALPASRHRGAARRRGRGPARGARAGEGRHLREARRGGGRARQRRRALRCPPWTSSLRGRTARELLRPRRRGRRAGCRRCARGDHARRQVRAIFFNIFGGITRWDEVARGILQAVEQMALELPIVVRLDGTNAEEGRQILRDAALPEPPHRGDHARRRAASGGARGLMPIIVDASTASSFRG